MSRIVFAGATSGLGRQAALRLARDGHDLVLVGRDAERGARLARETGGRFVRADLSVSTGVDHVAEQVAHRFDGVDVLVNNAGVMTPERRMTGEGIELNLAVHHLAPFSLTGRLLPLLRRGGGRVINVNSEGHRQSMFRAGPVRIDFEDLQSERNFDPFATYSRTKLANLLFTYELRRRYPELTVAAVHPGFVRTDLGRDFPRARVALLHLTALSARQGAAPVVHLATTRELVNGAYYDRFSQTRSSDASYDRETAQRLWDMTERLRGRFAVPVSDPSLDC
ncbi:SDR family NAD(P)-dependent oxidoreductase [Nocardia araoensis]|uniref:SDR family NAD(P)-dependent oxidoreductase n=1 Tax=Nocardia araoensis TaxID=228600 RepID=UPI0002DE7E53|nr:SDR family NAD(P)-dependent oxidoreductase [Nocardia araoensis]